MKFSPLRYGWLCLTIALIALTACGNAETATPAPTLTTAPTRKSISFPTPAPGWSLYSRSAYQIALPDAWQEIKLQPDELKNAITAAQNNNPPLAEQLRALLESGQAQNLIFYATDKNAAPIARNVSISRVPLQNTTDTQTFAKTYAEALPNIVRGAQVREVQAPLNINGLNAAAIVYDVSLVNDAEKLVTLRGVQYLYFLDSGIAYVITVTGDAADAEKFMPLARQIATSFASETP